MLRRYYISEVVYLSFVFVDHINILIPRMWCL